MRISDWSSDVCSSDLYRAYGPYEPKHGLRFNAHKLLIDPYARQLAGELKWHDALYGYRVGSPRGDLSFDRRDSAAYVPRAVVIDDHFDWVGDRPPHHARGGRSAEHTSELQ